MTVARNQLVDVNVTRYYHCISRCTRKARLLGEGSEHRKQWIEDRLQTLADAFAVSVCGFAVMDNHLHVLVRLDPDAANDWSAEDVVRRWLLAYPPKSANGQVLEVTQAWINDLASDEQRVDVLRSRLSNLGWFMKALKEPLARMANKEDDCKGAFWEPRFKSIAILDDEALLATCAYIDLNPLAAGLAATPETSPHTSVHQRVQHAAARGKLNELKAAASGSVSGSRAAGAVEEDLWLCPIEDRRREGSQREGLLEGFSLGSYLLLVDYTSRLCRQGKARVSREVASILDRLGTSAEVWGQRIQRLLGKTRLLGSYFSTDRQRLRQIAQQRGVHHLDNVAAPPA
ncbi:MAG: transposase [Planctomycetaceae bacterium]|nr:MAG: transposase [Planctomycetaceae bacterium]